MTKGKQHILIIDDNEDILNMIRLMLHLKGYEVSTQMNIIRLEDSIRELLPDLVIMDVLLSGADGKVICRSLKDNPELAHIPVLMISAHSHAKKECLDSGADAFLEKPFDMEEFLNIVEKSLLLRKE